MTLSQLDLLFPFFVFAYGAIMCFVNSLTEVLAKAEGKVHPYLLNRVRAHEPLGWVCLFVGGLWSLQNLM
ncbi:hypothetical protein GW916_02490 [bacterium]|nr:hypothetical protein [bacterium]